MEERFEYLIVQGLSFSADRGPWGSPETFPDQQNFCLPVLWGPPLNFHLNLSRFCQRPIWFEYLILFLRHTSLCWQIALRKCFYTAIRCWRATELLPTNRRWIFEEGGRVHTMDSSWLLCAALNWLTSIPLQFEYFTPYHPPFSLSLLLWLQCCSS